MVLKPCEVVIGQSVTLVGLPTGLVAIFDRVDHFGCVVGWIRLFRVGLGLAFYGLSWNGRGGLIAPTGYEPDGQKCDKNNLQMFALHKTPNLSNGAC